MQQLVDRLAGGLGNQLATPLVDLVGFVEEQALVDDQEGVGQRGRYVLLQHVTNVFEDLAALGELCKRARKIR